MTAEVQQIIVYIILAIVAIILVRYIVRRVRHRNDVTCCNCDECPYSQCPTQKNISRECKKKDKNIAQSDK
ncbi:MAG: FeoB-associated Cys-rich membrane protein [Bacteroidaceae bacterium]|nr:FeoB-associated Cys-rich membrane protein [Bacteroidaceae bacterium]